METWERPWPPQLRGRVPDKKPSFSSTLLDAIYRSIDENHPGGHLTGGARDPCFPCSTRIKKQGTTVENLDTRSNQVRIGGKAVTRSKQDYRVFDSSVTEPVFAGLRPIRTGLPRPAREEPKKQKPPARSPGARLASFVNSLIAVARSPRKAKVAEEPACSTVASYSRSCLSKAGSARERANAASGLKRTVRFNIEGATSARKAAVMDNMEAESNEDKESDSSSDLFELEILKADIRGAGYRDELPVYETTHVRVGRGPSPRC